LRFSAGAEAGAGALSARVSVAVAKTTDCGNPWYAYENADAVAGLDPLLSPAGNLGRLWTATLTEAKAEGRSVRIVGTGVCDKFGLEGVSFVEQHVGSTHVCARSGAAPIITLNADVIAVGQMPGRKRIGYQLLVNKEGLLILVDDAPDLQPNQIRLEIDIDPFGTGKNKRIEAWSFCQGSTVGFVEASMQGGFGVGVTCNPISQANDFRSGCTNTQTMVLNQNTTSEIWLRKRDWAGIWHTAEGIDSTIWKAFGGRSVRFIWRTD
jgi:hypothetical protein